MNIRELSRWQWNGYANYHRSKTNLLLHIVVVPMFLAGNVGLVISIFAASWVAALVSLLAMGVSVALQGRGHRTEEVPPVPFSSRANAVSRILLEQWISFPRFVLSGGWSHEWVRQHPKRVASESYAPFPPE